MYLYMSFLISILANNTKLKYPKSNINFGIFAYNQILYRSQV